MVASGAGTIRWVRFVLVFAPDGSFTGTKADSDGNTGTTSSKFKMSSDGKITDPVNNPKMLCTMDAGKTVFACTDTPDTGIAQLAVFTKQGGSYVPADQAGTWIGNALASGQASNWWARIAYDIAANGSFTGTFSDSAGHTDVPASGTFSLTPDGIITEASSPHMLCNMDAGNTVVACTDTPITGAAVMTVMTRQGPSYTLADLAGTWAGSSLATGPVAPWWQRATFTVKPDGTYTAQKTFNDGTSKTGGGTLLLSADGVMKYAEDNDILCQLDANKTVISCTKTQKDGLSTQLDVLTRKLK